MSKFKVGDVVRVAVSGHGCWTEPVGEEVTITEVGKYGRGVGYVVSPAVGNSYTGACNGFIGEDTFELVQSKTVHPHDEVIRAWLDGNVCQLRNAIDWVDMPSAEDCVTHNRAMPTFTPSQEIRVKPVKSEAELERDAIKEEMDKLSKRLEALKVD